MTAPKRYKKTEQTTDGVRIKPSDVVGALLLVKVHELKTGIKTKYDDDASAVSLDIVSVETGNVAPDQLWFNGAVVDGLKDYVGDVLPIRLEWATSASSGNAYLTVAEVEDAEFDAATQFLEANPNVFDADPGEAAPPAPASSAPAKKATKARW